ncbi:kinesin-like protein Klp61F [Drosophila sulfurigaster albostrigata]|uniref:kinesin-like protein Klp61F n=1 Tax=Drosophila sulfurigaster albostrigata TaxID=89887 RepID=UPI002D21AC0D|nr:kinesin-like protein Klp61F [Drosophila sulfurigaster albostrigata]
MDITSGANGSRQQPARKSNQNIQVYVRVRPLNSRERCIRSAEVVDVQPPKEIVTRHTVDSKLTKKFTFDRTFGPDSRQCDVYSTVVAPLIEEVLAGYNCTVFAYGQTGTGKTHTMVGNECAELKSSWEDDSDIGIIPRALSHLFDELRMMELEYTMRISYLELYNEELCDLLSTDDNVKIRIFDDSSKKGSVIIQGLEEIPVHSKDDVYKLLEKGKERRKTATTLMNAQSSRSHTVFSIVVHIRENGIDGEEMLKIGKLNLVDLAGSENVSKAGNEKGIRVRETVNINQSLLTLGRVITALVDRAPHVPYRESKLTRLLQESLGGRTKTSIIATISPGHKDIEETLSTLEYAHRAKNIQNKPEVNQKLTKKTVLKEYTDEIDKLKRDLMAARDKNGIYLAEDTYGEMMLKMDSQTRELNEKMLLLKALKDELQNKEKIFNEVSMSLVKKTQKLSRTEQNLSETKGSLLLTKKVLSKTKRRYKEKKQLVESHVKTEEQLTTQANQILAAADLATADTQQLHGTIERRRQVDDMIRNTCAQFAERMRENLGMLDGSLAQYQEQHAGSTQQLTEELANCTSVHQRLVANATKSINNLRDICCESLAAHGQLQAKFVSAVASNGDAQSQALLAQLLEHMEHRRTQLSQDMLANLQELEANNMRHREALDNMRDGFAPIIERNAKAVQQHVEQVQQQLNQLTTLSAPDAEQLQQLQAELAYEEQLAQQEQALFQQLEQLQQQRAKNTGSMSTRVGQLKRSHVAINEQAQLTGNSVLAYGTQSTVAAQAARDELCSQLQAATLIVDHGVSKCSTLHVQLDNLCKASDKQAESSMQMVRAQQQQLRQLCGDNEEQAKQLREEQQKQLKLATEQIHQIMTTDVELGIGHAAITGELIEELAKQMNQHATVQRQQLQTCHESVSHFHQSELKTYAPTGATPSKRDFVYPRTLVATSPHQDIVRRYRQEQDWSDLDTTATIDECSEPEESLQSVQELSETETIMNSTPIDPVDNAGIINKRSSGNGRSSNTLKPFANGQRNSSLSRSLTPSKYSPRNSPRNSPIGSPAFNRHNKENVA